MSEGSVEIEQLMVPVVDGADDMTGITPEAMSEFEDRMESMGVEKDTPAWRFYFQEFGGLQRGELDPSAEPGVFNEDEHLDLGHSKRRRLRREEVEERLPEPSLPGGPVAPPAGLGARGNSADQKDAFGEHLTAEKTAFGS